MKQTSRPQTPTPTTFSGISNYRTDSYRPLGYRQISEIHYAELGKYLASYLAKGTDILSNLIGALSHALFIFKLLPILVRVRGQSSLD